MIRRSSLSSQASKGSSVGHSVLSKCNQHSLVCIRRSIGGPVVTTNAAASAAATSTTTSVNNAPSPSARKALFGVATEHGSDVEAAVTGQLPAWLSGSLLVNGGGDYSRMQHMFDGYACVTKVKVSGGRAWGSQRYLDTEAFRTYKQRGRVSFREFATPAEATGPLGEVQQLLGQLAGLMTGNSSFTDNASVNLVPVDAAAARKSGSGGSSKLLLAMSETPAANYLVDPDTCETVEQVQYSDGLPGELSTAHPSVLSDGSLVNFSRSLPFGGFHVYKQDPHTLRRTQVAFVPDRSPLSPAWVHDFAATDKYAVIIEQPLYMNLGSLLAATPASHIFMNWQPQDEVKIHLVALDGSKLVQSFTCPTFFFFHVSNAFESSDGTCLHVDLAAYDDPQILLDLNLDTLRHPQTDAAGRLQQQVSPSSYRRLTIPLGAKQDSRLKAPQPLLDAQTHGQFCEFPAVNPAWRSKAYRYTYFLSAVRPTNIGNALSKADLQTGAVQTWHAPGGAVGEPAFVARPGARDEADGVVVAPGVTAEGQGMLVVLDASSWSQLALVTLPFGVPNRFHGTWLPQ